MQPFFFIKDKSKNVKVSFHEIIYVEALDNYIRVVAENRILTIRCTMAQMEKVLPVAMFCRIHRSYIISLSHIISFNKSVVILQNLKLPISDQYKNNLLQIVTILPEMEEDEIELATT